jgi:hypothetical protein
MAKLYSEDLRRRAVGTIELVSTSGQHETSAALKASRTEPSLPLMPSVRSARQSGHTRKGTPGGHRASAAGD